MPRSASCYSYEWMKRGHDSHRLFAERVQRLRLGQWLMSFGKQPPKSTSALLVTWFGGQTGQKSVTMAPVRDNSERWRHFLSRETRRHGKKTKWSVCTGIIDGPRHPPPPHHSLKARRHSQCTFKVCQHTFTKRAQKIKHEIRLIKANHERHKNWMIIRTNRRQMTTDEGADESNNLASATRKTKSQWSTYNEKRQTWQMRESDASQSRWIAGQNKRKKEDATNSCVEADHKKSRTFADLRELGWS